MYRWNTEGKKMRKTQAEKKIIFMKLKIGKIKQYTI